MAPVNSYPDRVVVARLNRLPYNVKGCQESISGSDKLMVGLIRNCWKKGERLQGVLPFLDDDLLNMRAADQYAIPIVDPN